jgi:hypothetical protein
MNIWLRLSKIEMIDIKLEIRVSCKINRRQSLANQLHLQIHLLIVEAYNQDLRTFVQNLGFPRSKRNNVSPLLSPISYNRNNF